MSSEGDGRALSSRGLVERGVYLCVLVSSATLFFWLSGMECEVYFCVLVSLATLTFGRFAVWDGMRSRVRTKIRCDEAPAWFIEAHDARAKTRSQDIRLHP